MSAADTRGALAELVHAGSATALAAAVSPAAPRGRYLASTAIRRLESVLRLPGRPSA